MTVQRARSHHATSQNPQDSDAIRPPIPTEVGHPFRLKPATL